MKQIFRIFAIAAVALSAAACQNDINDTIAPEGEGVSIRVTIADQTRVALGDFEEGKGYKLTFEEGDQILVTDTWGGTGTDADYWFTYTKTEGDAYVFTCTTEGGGALVGQKMSVFYLGGNVAGQGVLCNSEAGIDGIILSGSTNALGVENITVSAYPVLKLTSDYNVTLTTSKNAFAMVKSWGIGQYNTFSTTKAGTTYIPMFAYGEITLTASIKGEVVKSGTINFEMNKIYNLGTLEANEEQAVEGDTGVEITIDGTFADWANVTKIASYLPADATYTSMKTLKAYMDAENIYVYTEIEKVSDVLHMGVFLDLDNDQATGGKYSDSGWKGTCEALIKNQCVYNSKVIDYSWGSNKLFDSTGAEIGSFTFSGATPVLDNGVLYCEIVIPRSELPEIKGKNIGIAAYVLSNWGASGVLPAEGTLVMPVK